MFGDFLLLLIAHCSMPTAHCSMLIAHCSLPIAHCPLLTAHCSLLIALLSSHWPLSTAHCSLLCALFTVAQCLLLSAHCSLLSARPQIKANTNHQLEKKNIINYQSICILKLFKLLKIQKRSKGEQ